MARKMIPRRDWSELRGVGTPLPYPHFPTVWPRRHSRDNGFVRPYVEDADGSVWLYCVGCSRWMPPEAFRVKPSNKQLCNGEKGRTPMCKDCHNVMHREYRSTGVYPGMPGVKPSVAGFRSLSARPLYGPDNSPVIHPPRRLYPRRVTIDRSRQRQVVRPYIEDEKGERFYYCPACRYWFPMSYFPRTYQAHMAPIRTHCKRCFGAQSHRSRENTRVKKLERALGLPTA